MKVEPRFDCDVNDPVTTAVRAQGDSVLAGAKCHVPLAAEARHLLICARMGLKAVASYELTLAPKQAIAVMLADMATEIDAARLLTWEATWTMD